MSSKHTHNTSKDASVEETTLSADAQTEEIQENQELVSLDADGNALLSEESEDTDAEEEEEEEYVAPEDQKVFGIPRFCFWGVMIGFAMGYFLCGIVGLISNQEQSSSMYIASCGIAGYVISYLLYRRRTKAKEAAAALDSTPSSDEK